MRKRYKLKKRSCAMCKPDKMNWDCRWNNIELSALKEFEKEKKKVFG